MTLLVLIEGGVEGGKSGKAIEKVYNNVDQNNNPINKAKEKIDDKNIETNGLLRSRRKFRRCEIIEVYSSCTFFAFMLVL